MKSIVFLGAFALLIVLALGDVPQESSQDIAEASELGILERETREARRKRRKGKGKKGKSKGKAKGKGRKVRKGKGNGKKSIGNGKGKGQNNKGKGIKSGKRNNSNNKARNNQRQTSTVKVDYVKTVFSGYRTATNRLRQIKRILKFIKQIEKKHEKAKTEFTSAAKALDEATDGGSFCNGSAANNSVKADVLELNNCSNSAAAKCVVPNITQDPGCNNDLQACEILLDVSVNSTKNWLQNPSTATFPDVVYADPCCIDLAKNNEANVKTAKDTCVGSDTGSFGSCSAILKEAAGLVLDCGKITDNPPPTTTAASSGRHRIFKFQQQLF